MKFKLTILALLCILILHTSCDGLVRHQGYVRDSQTEMPISHATIKFDNREFKSDSFGYFEIRYMTNFQPDLDFKVEKENYKTECIKIEIEDQELIYRVRKETKREEGATLTNSLNFKVKDDTIHFLLTKETHN